MAKATMRKDRSGISDEGIQRYAELILKNPKKRLQYAQLLIDNPLWSAMFVTIKQQFFEDFCEFTDMESRERIAMALDMLDDLKDQVEGFVKMGTPLKLIKTGDSNGS